MRLEAMKRQAGRPSKENATLAGAVYGIYKGETLVDKYVTDKNGQFTTKEYICDDDWTIREITPSEGYLLDTTIHKVGAEPQLYTVEHNQTANDVTEQVKPYLTIDEATAYTGIGRDKLYEMTSQEKCPFVLWVGNRRMIKRRVFDEYIEKMYSI